MSELFSLFQHGVYSVRVGGGGGGGGVLLLLDHKFL